MNTKPQATERNNTIAKMLPGMLLTLGIASIAFVLYWFLKGTALKLSALVWALVISILLANLVPKATEAVFQEGIEVASSRLLRFAIGLFGLTFSAAVWLQLGGIGLLSVLINLIFVFTFGFVFWKYVLKLDNALAILIAAGTSICGASAIAAIGPALKAKAEEIGMALAVITLFGLTAIFVYPVLFNGPLNHWLNSMPTAYGMWVGMGVHDTSQVVAAGSQVAGASSMALSAKFIRVFMIGPMVFISLFLFHRFSKDTSTGKFKWSVPWFAVAFILLTFVNLGINALPIKNSWTTFNVNFLQPGIIFLLAWAFSAIGLKVKLSMLRKIGLKAFLGGTAVAVVAGISALLLVKFLWIPFN